MLPDNVRRLGCFVAEDNGSAPRLDAKFPNVRFQGTNIYLHVDAGAGKRVKDGKAFSQNSDRIVEHFLEAAAGFGPGPFYLNISIEPTAPEGYDYVAGDDGQAIVKQAALDLAGYRSLAADQGLALDVVVRYASEMNLGAYKSHGDVHAE
ncbi:hypothetical protein BH11ARM2_BH11ARM2_07920 [soil metagenome]